MESKYEQSVYVFKIESEYEVVKIHRTRFKSDLSDEEINRLLFLYSNKKVKNMYNGKAARLDDIKIFEQKVVFEISQVNFFDFLTSNMIYMKYANIMDLIKYDEEFDNDLALLNKVKNSIQKESNIDSFENVIKNTKLANIIAVSILIEDKDGNFGLVRRTSNLAIGSNLLGVTATGSLDDTDFNEDDPVSCCARRELQEELNIIPKSLLLKSVVISKTKLQPIFLFNYKLDCCWKEIIQEVKKARDYNNEVCEFYAIPRSHILSFIEGESLSDAAKYHIYSAVSNGVPEINDIVFNKEEYKL